MQYIISVLKSRTVQVLVVTFIVNGLQAIHPLVSGGVQVAIDAILTGAAVYFRVNPVQVYPKV